MGRSHEDVHLTTVTGVSTRRRLWKWCKEGLHGINDIVRYFQMKSWANNTFLHHHAVSPSLKVVKNKNEKVSAPLLSRCPFPESAAEGSRLEDPVIVEKS